MGVLLQMSDENVSFEVESDGQFYITIADGAHIYESKDDAISEIGDILDEDDDAFIAETSIEVSTQSSLDQDGITPLLRMVLMRSYVTSLKLMILRLLLSHSKRMRSVKISPMKNGCARSGCSMR